MISIVIPYYNRLQLLINTVKSIEFFSRDRDVEVIIVDDGSNEEEEASKILTLFPSLNVHIISIGRGDSAWRAPATAFNTGFLHAQGDIVLLNSSDCVHAGDILGFVNHHMRPKTYLCFATLAGTEHLNGFINEAEWNYTTIEQVKKLYGFQNGWWRCHSTNRILLPFCASIRREDLEAISGYDERFTNGIGYDDCDFIDRVYNLGVNMVLIDEPFCIHQHHPLVNYTNSRNKDLLERLTKENPQRIKASENKVYVR